ncbi:MAG: enoyl-CoA hydratase [Hyphomicrobiales bacterium]|nr:enoyl-CoA hydratase [Hyphomicrobiales bacterium]
MNEARLDYAAKDGLARITLHQPAKLNAMSFDMWTSLPGLVARAVEDDSVRAIVVEGSGARAFCSGADISQFGEKRSDAEGANAYERAVTAGLAALSSGPKPTLARINGICFGGGLALALSCDLRLASETARFCLPAAKLGLGYAFSNIDFMVRRIGLGAAADILYSARTFEAREAQRLGIVTNVFGAETFFEESNAYLARVSGNAPLTLKAMALSLRELQTAESARDPSAANAAVAACYVSEDYAEGRRAFAEKRAPVFKGK